MSYKSKFIALSLGLISVAAQAQLTKPAMPPALAPTAAATPATATTPPGGTQSATTTATASAPAAAPMRPAAHAPGVVTLSDVANQPDGQTSNAPVAQVSVPALVAVDGSGEAIDAARAQMRGAPQVAPVSKQSIILTRISRVGSEATAVLWIKGQHRKVATGSRALDYTIGEIKEDGVCLYSAKAKGGNKCSRLITFAKGL